MNPNRSNASFWPDDGLILYDGVCVLCSGWTRFVLRRDCNRLFRFTPIQSDYGSALARALGIDPADPDTNAVIWKGVAFRRSDAALRVLSLLPGLGWVGMLHMVPRLLRDMIYRLVARTRYRVWGRHAICDLGGETYADRVVTVLPSTYLA
jgi:predicted DCC family thiol-disulfide oxidoreductase YuxK